MYYIYIYYVTVFPPIVVSSVSRSHFGMSVRPIFTGSTNCNGSENSLLECTTANSGGNSNEQCAHSEEAGVICGGKENETKRERGSEGVSGRRD